MATALQATRLHWNYYLTLEKDLEAVSRYIEFSEANFNTFSIELSRLLFAAASEVDTLAKCVCRRIASTRCRNIDDYRAMIVKAEEEEQFPSTGPSNSSRYRGRTVPPQSRHCLWNLKVFIPRYGLMFAPWQSWASGRNPDWWHSYNKVKHQRDLYFSQATLPHAVYAVGALLAMNYVHCRYELAKDEPTELYLCRKQKVTRSLQPRSSFLQFSPDFYDNIYEDIATMLSVEP